MPIGFIGTHQDRIEKLFIGSNEYGQGIDKQLLEYVLNEQNPQAIGFYQYMDCVVVKHIETDGESDPYPILTMKYQKYSCTRNRHV